MRNDITDFTRLILKQTATTGEKGTIPASDDHTDGTWLSTDLYVGEGLVNTTDNILYIRTVGGITEVELGGADSEIFTVVKIITSANILTLASSPAILIAADSTRAVEIISASGYMDFNTTAYATAKQLDIYTDTATISQMTETELLKSTVARGLRFTQSVIAVATTDTCLINNKDIILKSDVDGSDGDSDLTVFLTYRYITLP